jgi:tetratricopeptide (TPR) repeat protein
LIVELMRRVAPTWLLQLPWFVEEGDRRDFKNEANGATQDRMLREFGELVDRLTEEQIVLLVLEDLQWSDSATVQLLGYLARRRRDCALMLIGTFRPTELILHEHPLAGLVQEMKPRNQCIEIDLEYFAETELGEFLTARLGRAPTDDFVRALHSHTLGLPLFVTAALDDLLASGKIKKDTTGWTFPDPQALTIPRNISGLLESQVLRLSVDQQRALGAASVCGMHFLHLALVDVLQIAPESLQQLLEDAAARLPWLRGEGVSSVAHGRVSARYAFAHTLYRQTLYERLPMLQRIEWHRLWAKALAELHISAPAEIAAELALHFERGNEPVQAASQLAMVASRAMAVGAPHEALLATRHGLQLAANFMDPALELELRSLEAVATTRAHALSAPEVAAAFARARAMGPADGPAWRRTLQGCWWVHFTLAEYAQGIALAREILEQAEQRADAALQLAGLNAMGIVLALTGDYAAARSHLERAVEAHAKLPAALASSGFVQDPAVEADLALILVYWMTGEPQRARALAERAVVLAASLRHPVSEATALYAASIVHALAGEFNTVYSLTERLNALVSEHSLPDKRSGFAWLHGQALVALGRVNEGLSEMRAAAQNVRDLGLRTGLGGFHYHYAVACRMAGCFSDAEASVQAGLDFVEEVEEKSLLAPLLGLRAEIEMSNGEVATASATWKHAISVAKSQGAVFHELVLHAAALGTGSPAADSDRLRCLLASYDNDPSPVIGNARALVASTTQVHR